LGRGSITLASGNRQQEVGADDMAGGFAARPADLVQDITLVIGERRKGSFWRRVMVGLW
jgi:hypothetical protein